MKTSKRNTKPKQEERSLLLRQGRVSAAAGLGMVTQTKMQGKKRTNKSDIRQQRARNMKVVVQDEEKEQYT